LRFATGVLSQASLNRRDLLRAGLGSGLVLGFGAGFWQDAMAAVPGNALSRDPAVPGRGPYGPLGPQDANGLRLPAGFSSRRIAVGGQTVPGTNFVQPLFPDGQAAYPTDDGGFVLVTNSEVPDATPGQGGASAIRLDRDFAVVGAYRILSGTSNNCAGGRTLWGTWMSCEETDRGLVYECDPFGRRPGVPHPALGRFEHEAVAVDPQGRRIYLSEDNREGGFYRFTPARWPDASSGLLEIAELHEDGAVTWHGVPDPSAATIQTRDQVPQATAFRRGEGLWFDSGVVYLATTADNRVWAYNTGTVTMDVVYDGGALGSRAPLLNVDNVTVAPSGDLFVAEDPGDIGMGIITPEREVARFLSISGAGQRTPDGLPEDVNSEVTGPVFDPTGQRLYLCGQRSFGTGAIYEISGPFRRQRVDAAPPPIRLAIPDELDLAEVERRGPRVALRVGEPCTLIAVLRARLPRDRGEAPRTTHLARRTLERNQLGSVIVRLRRREDLLRYTRGRRRIEAQMKIVAVDANGLRATLTQPVTLVRR